MAGLVEKDFRLIWCNKQALIFLLIIGVVIGLQNEAVILGWLPFAISILLINTVTYDELDKGYGFLMTLPIDAETYVREKYFFCLTGGTVSWRIFLRRRMGRAGGWAGSSLADFSGGWH